MTKQLDDKQLEVEETEVVVNPSIRISHKVPEKEEREECRQDAGHKWFIVAHALYFYGAFCRPL